MSYTGYEEYMRKKERYKSRRLTARKSGTERVFRNHRKIVIILWLMLSLVIGVIIYKGFTADRFSDTPVKNIQLEGGVKTGCDLNEELPFGPWNPAGNRIK